MRKRDEVGKERGGSASGFVYEGDSPDDDLSKLMPSLKRQLEAFDDDEGTLNFMGEIIMNKMENFRPVDKENVVSDRNSMRQVRRRRGQVTSSRPIDFNKLLSSNKTVIPAPSGRFYENITVLKENVNRAGIQCQVVDDFWSTGKKKKISAVARRRLLGIKTPAQAKPKAVEDRNVRHARSRRGGGKSRTLDRRSIKLDLHLDAAKISEWDQETLAEEEVPPSSRAYSGSFMVAGRPAADVEEEVSPATQVHSGASMSAARPAVDAEDEVPPSTGAHSGASLAAGKTAADSPCSLLDMELSPGHSPLMEVARLSGGVERAQTPLPDPGSAHAVSPAPESNLQKQRFPLTSPTPPANPVAAYMSLRRLEGDVGQRRLSFVSSPSTESTHGSSRHLEGDVTQRRLSFISSPPSESTGTGRSREVGICIVSQDENALWTISHDYREDDEGLEVPDFQEADLHHKYNGSSLGGQTVPNGLQQNQEHNEDLEVLHGKEAELHGRQNSSSLGEQTEPSGLQQNQEDNEDLEVPDVKEAELHHRQNGSSLGERSEPNKLQPNQEESFDEVHIENEAQVLRDKLLEAADSEAAPPLADEHQNNPPTEGLNGTDEGSTTQTKPTRVKRRAKKAENRRFSLEDCGSIWTDGKRKSQRIKVRPLEWWRGEKLLHSRIHDSLTTVVGVKFSSPGKYARGINQEFVVESFVPAQYTERVRFAAI